MRELTIRGRRIADNERPYLICDLSHNHGGFFDTAREMIDQAAKAGADAVKLQKRGASTYAGLRAAGEVEYANLRESRELSESDYRFLRDEAHRVGLAFIVTAFDWESIDFLAGIHVDAVKVASGDITNTPLLRAVPLLPVPILVSTGGCEMADIERAFNELAGCSLAILHCVSEYPTPPEHLNLRMILSLRATFPETVIGLSSHVDRERFATPALMAWGLGARIIEQHMTLTPQSGGEHDWALVASDLAFLRKALRVIPKALGDGTKHIHDYERQGIRRLGKHLIYSRPLAAGHLLTDSDIGSTGCGDGVAPNRLGEFIGKQLHWPVEAGTDLQVEQVRLDTPPEGLRYGWGYL